MPIAKVGRFQKADVAISQSQLPPSWVQATYGPGFPIEPFVSPHETEVPREIDYPISVNASLQPRIGYGLVPFSALKEIYETITEVRMPIQMSLRQLTGFKPHLVDDEHNEVDGHPFQWICDSPDGVTPFDVWLTRFMKSSDIFDAGTFYKHRDSKGNLISLNYLDGSTIFIIINDLGNVPNSDDYDRNVVNTTKYIEKLRKYEEAHPGLKPHSSLHTMLLKRTDGTIQVQTPAYAQIIKGTPFAWYTQDEIWYKPRSRRYDAPYGETFIEQAWAWVMLIANITGFELAHYRSGNMPEGLLIGPDGWALEKLSGWESAFNARQSGAATARMRTRVVPHGFTWQVTKKADFPDKLYQKAFDNIVMTFGYPPTEFGQFTGRGLGGKDVGDLLQDKAFRDAIIPRKIYFENALNSVLQHEGVDDVVLELELPMISTDPEKEREGIFEGVQHGLLTPNDALGRLGYDPMAGSMDEKGNPIPTHIGNKHIVIAGTMIYILDDMKEENGVGVPAVDNKPPQVQAANGEPIEGEVDPAEQQRQLPDTRRTVQQLLETGKEGTATYSFPSEEKAEAVKRMFDVGGKLVLIAPVKEVDADVLAHELNIDWQVVDKQQFMEGLNEELEHSDTVHGDADTIGEIVLDHLKEDPKYYDHLSKSVDKGGAGSGDFGHPGRPPLLGGSAPTGAAGRQPKEFNPAAAGHEEMHNWLQNNQNNPVESERKSINNYTGFGYKQINDSLRKGAEASPQTKADIKNISTYIRNNSLQQDVVLFRAGEVDKATAAKLQMRADNPNMKMSILDKGFMSTSLNEHVANEFMAQHAAGDNVVVKFKIEAPKGTDAAAVRGAFNEHEVLFDKNSRFVVTDVTPSTYHGLDYYYITMRAR